MAFLDLLFSLNKNERNVTFEGISTRADLPINEVELLVMRAMSLGLLRGQIDQVIIINKYIFINNKILI
jgi:26S proteasome regulatory subunit N9